MGIANSNKNYSGLVQKYIGTAYDKVAAVAAQLLDIEAISNTIDDGTFLEVADAVEDIATLSAKIDNFNNTYYGIRAVPPATDPSGQPITEGDLYYDSYKNLMHVYVENFWVPLGAANYTVEVIQLSAGHFAGNIVTLPLVNPYIPGANNITVHHNGELIVSIQADSRYGQYSEEGEYLIELDTTRIPLAIDDLLTMQVATEAATVTHMGKVEKYTLTTTIENQQIFDVPNGQTYVPGDNNMEVYFKTDSSNRELQIAGVDYNETSPREIQSANPLQQNTEILFVIGTIISNIPDRYDVIMSVGVPREKDFLPGQLWFKTDVGRMFVLFQDQVGNPADTDLQWISITGEDYIIDAGFTPVVPPPQPAIHGTVFQDVAPDPTLFAEGTLWFNNNNGTLHILYIDNGTEIGDAAQWVKVST